MVSKVIKGCWQLSGGHRGDPVTDRTAGRAAVDDFLQFASAGITTFDAADHYGPAETLIGRFLVQHPEWRPKVQLLSKYCVFNGLDMATLNKFAVRKAVDTSRQRLQVSSVDLMQLYWQDYAVGRYVDAALYLCELGPDGGVSHVGVTNFDTPRLQQMVDAGARIVSSQVQYSLLDLRPERAMAPFCQQHGISLLPYGVLAGGFLSDKYLGVPAESVSIDTYSKSKYASVLRQDGGWAWLQRLLQALRGVADRHNTTISNVAARWVLQRPGVGAVILGARNASHIADYQQLFAFALDAADEDSISSVLDVAVQPVGDCYEWERGGRW